MEVEVVNVHSDLGTIGPVTGYSACGNIFVSSDLAVAG
jgi:hypothetical protein